MDVQVSQESNVVPEPPDEADLKLIPLPGRDPYYCLHKNIVMRKNALGHGLYATAPIRAGELIYTAKDSTTLATVSNATIASWPEAQRSLFATYAWQVGEEEWAGPSCEDDLRHDYVNFLNHSCDPTTWFTDYEVLHAKRDIKTGEEITFHYATCDVTSIECLLHGCLCGKSNCRGRMSPWDYRLPSMQAEYGQHFMPYINDRVRAEPKVQLGNGAYSQLHRAVEMRESGISGKGLFATEFIPKHSIVWYDEGRQGDARINWTAVQAFPDEKKRWFLKFCWQVDDEVFSAPANANEIDRDNSNFMNHSCDPTTWFLGDRMMEARRDIYPGEEITYDYGTVDSLIERIPECRCGASNCRGKVTGTDYLLPELQARYGLHFALYLLARMYTEWDPQSEALNEGN